ncbi:MAG: hypothetical protein CM1200mP10_03560 [Candidatus Neomarinimicrobiota bacterium]|nr:MAG: hypothetical protein CM1200mP10_03560 [Candidatus Neomarinimicrobiota bacterium]
MEIVIQKFISMIKVYGIPGLSSTVGPSVGWNVFDFPTWTLDGLGINVVSDSLGVPDEMLYVSWL